MDRVSLFGQIPTRTGGQYDQGVTGSTRRAPGCASAHPGAGLIAFAVRDPCLMKYINLAFVFSLACLALSLVFVIIDLIAHPTARDPMTFILLFVGLLGSYMTPVLKAHQRRLDFLESEIRSMEKNGDA